MSSSSIFSFSVFRGYFLEALYYWLSVISWALIGLWLYIFMLAGHPSPGQPGELTWADVLVVTPFIALCRLFYVVSNRLIFRRIEINFHADNVELVFRQFLFLSQKIVELNFSDISVCQVVAVKSRIRNDHLEIVMKDGHRYRISSQIRWLKRGVPEACFDIDAIRDRHTQYLVSKKDLESGSSHR